MIFPGCFFRKKSPKVGCFVHGSRNSMGCFVRAANMAWDVMFGVTKTVWDVLSRVANLCCVFCPGSQKIAWNGLSQDVLSGFRWFELIVSPC